MAIKVTISPIYAKYLYDQLGIDCNVLDVQSYGELASLSLDHEQYHGEVALSIDYSQHNNVNVHGNDFYMSHGVYGDIAEQWFIDELCDCLEDVSIDDLEEAE